MTSRALAIGASDTPAARRPEAPGGERRSSAPDFTVGGVLFECFRSADDQRFIWRSSCRRMAVWREGAEWKATFDGRPVGVSTTSPQAAMDAAVWAYRRSGSAGSRQAREVTP